MNKVPFSLHLNLASIRNLPTNQELSNVSAPKSSRVLGIFHNVSYKDKI